MENLSYLLTLTKDEENFLNRIVKERKRKRLLDRVEWSKLELLRKNLTPEIYTKLKHWQHKNFSIKNR